MPSSSPEGPSAPVGDGAGARPDDAGADSGIGSPPADAAASPLPLGAPCATDDACSGGSPGVERVCSTVSRTCIAACHTDHDCPAGQSCHEDVWRCGDAAANDAAAPPPDTGAPAPILAGYSAAAAVAYAEAHWDDGVGECAQFVSDSAVTAGGLAIGYTTWVPTLYVELESAAVPYDEYTPASPSVAGCPGDVVLYSNAAGADFCLPNDTTVPEQNCGHAGLVVVGGGDVGSIQADFHNNAHQHLPLDGILTGTVVDAAASSYSTLRVYHLSHCAFTSASGARRSR